MKWKLWFTSVWLTFFYSSIIIELWVDYSFLNTWANTHTFRLNTPNVNRNSGHTSFVMEIVYLSMSLSLGSTENLTLLGHTYTRTWHPLDLTLTGFFKDDEIEFFVARRRNLPDLIMYVWSTAILDFSVRSGGINKCGRR